MLLMERIQGQTGYLILTTDGAVVESGGDLSCDERIATIITSLISVSNKFDQNELQPNGYQKISISYDDHSYVICLSNKKIHIVKKIRTSNGPPVMNGTPSESCVINV